MNRKQRRIANKIPYSERPEFYEVEVPFETEIKDGDLFTVAGHKRLINGVLITDCDPGEETIFKARLIRH
jgi:uncharacterized Zn finger protein